MSTIYSFNRSSSRFRCKVLTNGLRKSMLLAAVCFSPSAVMAQSASSQVSSLSIQAFLLIGLFLVFLYLFFTLVKKGISQAEKKSMQNSLKKKGHKRSITSNI